MVAPTVTFADGDTGTNGMVLRVGDAFLAALQGTVDRTTRVGLYDADRTARWQIRPRGRFDVHRVDDAAVIVPSAPAFDGEATAERVEGRDLATGELRWR